MIRTRRTTIPYKLLSVLLRYPDERLVEARDELAAAVAALPRSPQRDLLQRFVAYLAANTRSELERRYVETFDLRRGSGLYLSYYLHGDTRKRGMALLRLKRLYAAAGLELTSGELSDYLPLMLEFAALAPDGAGDALLREHRPALELLRGSLRDADSPYADVLDAISAALPRLSALEREHVRRLSEAGPPSEQVGLQPFAPPEVMPEQARV
ncbi:MAG TPA: nitrate reductase molybdenum cofactor assembly chaperone [Thermoleophilaceae bacterium]|nr:nitrate reductase molybdenum cofactor assembly chaperone [Thermoleophilaceae bacterium]